MEKKIFMNKPVYLGLSILERSMSISTNISTRFGMTVWTQNIEKKQKYVTWIKIALSFT